MPRVSHGDTVSLNALEAAGTVLATHSPAMRTAFARPLREQLQSFNFLFPDLQTDDANLLPVTPQTVEHLRALGQTMGDPLPATVEGDSGIPAVYTYFGQFVDHDISFEATDPPVDITSVALAPLSQESIATSIRNQRTSALDLDSVYRTGPMDGVVPYDGEKLRVGTVSRMPNTPPFNSGNIPFKRPPRAVGDDFNDLPRKGPSTDARTDREAQIGDERNDENTIVAQLHVAFLRAHNALIDNGNNFKKAQRLLRQHYQHIVIHDFLKRIADPQVVDDIISNGNQVYKHDRDAFMPIEFSFAAYRFGHTMARNEYDFNLNFNMSGVNGAVPASFALLFTFTALSGELGNQGLGESLTLPENWIVEWEHLIDAAKPGGTARRIDTRLAAPGLFELRGFDGTMLHGEIMSHLAKRNLLRGYLFRVPTGQAVARKLGQTPLTRAEFQQAAATPEEFNALDAGGFVERTPLWYYVLAEAAARTGGKRLGPVGSTIIAEVLIGLVRRSEDSILKGQRRWKPSLPSAQPGTFTLPDLLRFAGVLSGG